jgi:hypothetical protein
MSLPWATAPIPAATEEAAPPFVVGEPAHRIAGRIGAPDDDGSGVSQIGDHRIVVCSDKMPIGFDAAVRRMALLVDIDLHGHRNAVQRARRGAAPRAAVGLVGCRESFVVQGLHHCVEARIDGVEPRQSGERHLPAGDGAIRDHRPQLRGARLPERLGGRGPLFRFGGGAGCGKWLCHEGLSEAHNLVW